MKMKFEVSLSEKDFLELKEILQSTDCGPFRTDASVVRELFLLECGRSGNAEVRRRVGVKKIKT